MNAMPEHMSAIKRPIVKRGTQYGLKTYPNPVSIRDLINGSVIKVNLLVSPAVPALAIQALLRLIDTGIPGHRMHCKPSLGPSLIDAPKGSTKLNSTLALP